MWWKRSVFVALQQERYLQLVDVPTRYVRFTGGHYPQTFVGDKNSSCTYICVTFFLRCRMVNRREMSLSSNSRQTMCLRRSPWWLSIGWNLWGIILNNTLPTSCYGKERRNCNESVCSNGLAARIVHQAALSQWLTSTTKPSSQVKVYHGIPRPYHHWRYCHM